MYFLPKNNQYKKASIRIFVSANEEKDLINVLFVDSEKIEMKQEASSFTELFIDDKTTANHTVRKYQCPQLCLCVHCRQIKDLTNFFFNKMNGPELCLSKGPDGLLLLQ